MPSNQPVPLHTVKPAMVVKQPQLDCFFLVSNQVTPSGGISVIELDSGMHFCLAPDCSVIQINQAIQ